MTKEPKKIMPLNLEHDYELYTPAGNNLAAQLIAAITSDILEDKLTRAQAINRVQEAIKQIREIDEGMCDSEPHYAIAHRINKAFKQVGYERYEP